MDRPSFLLRDQAFGVPLRLIDQAVPPVLDVLRRPPLERDMIRHVDRVDHVDRIPRADLGAMLAPDATIEVDVAERLQAGMFLARNLVDTIDRADFQASLAPRASVGMDHG